MKLIGALSWYDANPAWLAASVASMAKIGVQHVVALDGAYAHFPNKAARSGGEQAEALHMICDSLDIGLTLHRPNRYWESEIEKRTALMRMAAAQGKVGEDWIFVLDDDEVATEGSPATVRQAISEALADNPDALTGWTRYEQCMPSWLTKPEEREATEAFQRRYNTPHRVGCFQSRLFRIVENMRVEDTHYCYKGEWNGQTMNLRNDNTSRKSGCVDSVQFTVEGVTVEHRDLLRPLSRRVDKKTYYDVRDDLGLERTAEQVASSVPTGAVV